MNSAEITFTTEKPKLPEADFAFCIDFKKGEGSASRVFSATGEFIKACERLDRELVTSIDSNIETVMVLEDIQAASLKTWFRNIVSSTDDQALKNLDWKKLIGKYLVEAKYAVLKYMDKPTEDEEPNIQALSQEIHQHAVNADVRHIPDYTPPNPMTLIDAIRDFEGIKDRLHEEDKASMILQDKREAKFNLSTRLDIKRIEALAVRETQSYLVSQMVLIVKKPDFLGTSMWDFRHGKKPVSASIEDREWLNDFQNRKVNVQPGDAIRCEVRIDVLYGHDNELFAERYYVTRVKEVLEDRYRQPPLFKKED